MLYNKEKILKCSSGNNGYLAVHFFHNKLIYPKYTHRLVAEYFLDNFDNSLQVNHKDFNTANNIVNNLEMVTNLENAGHKKLAKRKCSIKKGHTLNEEQVRDIRSNKLKYREYSEKYNISISYISDITNGKYYKWVK